MSAANRPGMRFMLSFCVVLALVGTGCSKQSTSAKQNVPDLSNVDQKATALESKVGSVKFGASSVDAAKLGVPLYPGAKPTEGGGLDATTAEGSAQILVLTTGDSFDKVYAWYKSKMPAGSEKARSSSADNSFASFEVVKNGSKEISSVELSTDGGKTQIAIAHGTK
ncbi:MAG TPA: hypothetical protein VN934_03145 [Candidatus Tumulicola sp.]|nr:hypothetical protein [Candidatus Tumulicola sp.]